MIVNKVHGVLRRINWVNKEWTPTTAIGRPNFVDSQFNLVFLYSFYKSMNEQNNQWTSLSTKNERQ